MSYKNTVQGYLHSKAPTEHPKYPVGKIAGNDSHTYNGSSIMHVLTKDENDEWVLLCKPSKKGIYNYRGFRQAISCIVCNRKREK